MLREEKFYFFPRVFEKVGNPLQFDFHSIHEKPDKLTSVYLFAHTYASICTHTPTNLKLRIEN